MRRPDALIRKIFKIRYFVCSISHQALLSCVKNVRRKIVAKYFLRSNCVHTSLAYAEL